MAEHEERSRRPMPDEEGRARHPDEAPEEGGQHPEHGRTVGDTATSYNSVGGPREGETERAGAGRTAHRVRFRPAPGGTVEETDEDEGLDLPYTGEAMSTRGSNFEEDPNTGEPAEEVEGEFIRESLEKRTRGNDGQ